jgi:polyhydroxyalkanoate synthesis regulator protein
MRKAEMLRKMAEIREEAKLKIRAIRIHAADPELGDLIIKYANRKLYSKALAGYLTLNEIYDLHIAGVKFKILSKTRFGADITAETLLEAIFSKHKDDQEFFDYLLKFKKEGES